MLSAGGTLDQQPASFARRLWLFLELELLFIVAPLMMVEAVHTYRAPLFLALLPVLAIVLVILAFDRTFSLKREAGRGISGLTLISILGVFAIGAIAVAAWLWRMHPDWLFEFPRRRPDVWARVMFIYPLASVAAQELVYRTFYFHRYGPLFGEWRWLGIVLNGLLFGFAHIVVGSPFAILGTCVTGLLFATRYASTRSFWAVFLEHTLWGWMVFTLGLGRYFFTGVSNV